jgi:predicted aspartyl protease
MAAQTNETVKHQSHASHRGKKTMKKSVIPGLVLMATLFAASSSATVPLTPIADGHLLVPVYVDGKGPYPFMLDTGADSSGVYQWFADETKLPTAGASIAISGMSGTVDMKQYRVSSFKLDGRELRDVTAYALPNRHDGAKIAGVIGNDLMGGTVTVFDFPCGQVTVHLKPADAAAIAGKGPAPIAAKRPADNTLLTIPVSLDGAKGIAVLDTGNRVTKVNLRFAKAAGLDPDSPDFHPADTIYGVSPTQGMVPKAGPLGSLSIGALRLDGVQGEVIDIKTFAEDFGDSPAMQIGTDLLGRFRLVYEHDANRFWLAPSTCPTPKSP